MENKTSAEVQVLDVEILRPLSESSRHSEYIVLPNGLHAYLISDPTTDKSAAALDVHVGHFSDPDEIPGLAHFCEHMLFLGTEKYPEEGSYQEYLKKHGGSNNAFTDMLNTNYHFDVNASGLEEALDRFAQFFIKPMFTEDCVFREIKAVDSEHTKNIQQDMWRMFQLLKSSSNPAHPFSKFGTGNISTLEETPKQNGLNIREELIKWYNKYYSANIMKLCVIGKEPLTTLREWVVAKFSAIPNKQLDVPDFGSIPYVHPESQVGKIYRIVPVRDLRSIKMVFPLDYPVSSLYLKKPLHYLSHLIGHEGQGSAYAFLKAKGWANALSSGQTFSFGNQTMFVVDITLTEEGENFFYEIIQVIFQYINMLKTEKVQKWIFDECKAIADDQFRFMDRANPYRLVINLAGNMHKYKPEHIFAGSIISTEYDAQVIASYLEQINPKNMFILSISKRHETLEDLQSEKWYGTKYAVANIAEKYINEWNHPTSTEKDLHLPAKNEFIATKFDLKAVNKEEGQSPEGYPVQLVANDLVNIWYKQDDKFKQPKANLVFQVVVPQSYSTPQNYLMIRLFSYLIDDALNQYAYSAQISGLDYSVSALASGFLVSVTGYDDKIQVLHQKVFEKFKTMELSQERFKIMKEKLTHEFKNSLRDQAYSYGFSKANQFLIENKYHTEEYLSVLDGVTFEYMTNFVKVFMNQLKVVGIIHGNLTKEEALEVSGFIEKKILNSVTPLLPVQEAFDRVAQLQHGLDYVLQCELPNKADENSSLEVVYQIGLSSNRDEVLVELFNQVISTRYYERLRTKEQLGYIVHTRSRLDHNVVSWSTIIQSSVKSPVGLLERNDLFVEEFLAELRDTITEEDVQRYLKSVKENILEEDKQMKVETIRNFNEITKRQYVFGRRQDKANVLETITKKDLLEFFERYFLKSSKERRRLVTQVFAGKVASEMNSQAAKKGFFHDAAANTIYITDIPKFKTSLPLYPAYVDYEVLNSKL